MLTEHERARVRKAVDEAESGLAAEIVPCVYAQSSPYPETVWAGAAAAVGLACGAVLARDMLSPVWTTVPVLMVRIAGAGLLGAALGRWSKPVKRFLLGRHRMDEAVSRRAKEVFFDRGIARTKARDGVLIFASLLERQVVVLADEGVRSKVKPEAWDAAIAALTEKASAGRTADGLVAAIQEAAKALRAAGLHGKGGRELGDDAVEGGVE